MAKEELEEIEENENIEKKSGLSTLKIVIIAVFLTVLLGGMLVGGTFYLVSSMYSAQTAATSAVADKNADAEENDEEADEEAGESEPLAAPIYLSMDPKFIVSFSDQKSARFMQFSIEVMSRDAQVIKKIEEHMPVIRSSLLMLFGGQQYEKMATREGKEKLLKEATSDINTSLQKISGDEEQVSSVEEAYFNSFVIQ
jgi:flagellar FliL protein